MEEKTGRSAIGLIVWLAIAVCASGALYYAASTGALSWSSLIEARTALGELVGQSPAVVVAAYVGAFMVLSLILWPAQLWIILVGGILFGFQVGFAITWFAAVASSIVVFLLSRSTLGGLYRNHASRYLERVRETFERDQVWYMLTLRLIPICPYCVANILPAMLGARFWLYVLATMIGVVPYIAVYSFIGTQASGLLTTGEPPDLADVSRAVVPVLAALASLPLLAIGTRYMMQRRRAQ